VYLDRFGHWYRRKWARRFQHTPPLYPAADRH
jgi:hypothetical protein